MENHKGLALLIKDILKEPEAVDLPKGMAFENLLYWHSALEAVQDAIESTIDYVQFGIGCPEDFSFDWYVASTKYTDLSGDTTLRLSTDDSIAMAYGITRLSTAERAVFVTELLELWEEINQVYLEARAPLEEHSDCDPIRERISA
ncbi:hypothetical protein O3Q51_09720 [Cryomorphaceae bacterium 1068]|nr:hypothetical protein [Cryomorphaceae bacterium 1068]